MGKTVLMVGSGFPYSEFLPQEGRRAAQIDLDGRMLGLRYGIVDSTGLRVLLHADEAAQHRGRRERKTLRPCSASGK